MLIGMGCARNLHSTAAPDAAEYTASFRNRCNAAGLYVSIAWADEQWRRSRERREMPHLTVEYSTNLASKVDILKLVEAVHGAALHTGMFEAAAVRTRAAAREHYVIADGNPENAFVAIWVRVGPGRPPETRQAAGQEIFDAACEFLKDVYEAGPLAISLEMQEMDNTAAFRKKNIKVAVSGKERGT